MHTVIGVRSGKPAASSNDQPTPTIWFDTWRQLAGVLSDENRALLRLMHEREPRTVLELAELSGPAASNLSRTLRTMEGYWVSSAKQKHGDPLYPPRSFGHRIPDGA